jgi:2-polyprenyl-3-methyl-5-hydroxy-6-metoxy-1,4-benzoquinol methylase
VTIEAFTDRQARERTYYDQFVQLSIPDVASLDAIRGEERRPWNPYWYIAAFVREYYRNPSQRLLDFGCGPGSYAVQFAHIGYEVSGFDISDGNVVAARALAERYGVAERTHFHVSTAEQLDYPSSVFDIIVGVDILHHVDIPRALAECLRVLKPGGVAIFKEPIEVPVFDWLRNTWLGRSLRPKEASFDRHITQDEKKLTAGDLTRITAMCNVEERRFRVVSRIESLIAASGQAWHTTSGASRLEMLDEHLLRACPPLGVFGGNVVLTCRHR